MYTLCNSCAPGPYIPQSAEIRLFEYDYGTSLHAIVDGNIKLDISHNMPQRTQWTNANNIQTLCCNMFEQLRNHLNNPNLDEHFEYAYGYLTDIEIVSNYEINGRDAGDNLADLFSIWIGEPLFSFPDGELVEYHTFRSSVFRSIEEYIQGKYFISSGLYINIMDKLNVKYHSKVDFTITLTLSDGVTEETFTSNFALEI